ncbi:MAG: hypothetical protein KKE02_08770, partial [Alphaproteobacteria bacterium]|nr:hypothetical protein [Alphaproteobacteria bacterium]
MSAPIARDSDSGDDIWVELPEVEDKPKRARRGRGRGRGRDGDAVAEAAPAIDAPEAVAAPACSG